MAIAVQYADDNRKKKKKKDTSVTKGLVSIPAAYLAAHTASAASALPILAAPGMVLGERSSEKSEAYRKLERLSFERGAHKNILSGPLYGAGPAYISRQKRVFLPDKDRPSHQGIYAHELGHAKDKFVNNPLGLFSYSMGQRVLGPGLLAAALLPHEGLAKGVAIGAGVMSLPTLYAEIKASLDGAKMIADMRKRRNERVRLSDVATPFIGVPTYLSAAAAPYLAYLVKKKLDGYTYKSKDTKKDKKGKKKKDKRNK